MPRKSRKTQPAETTKEPTPQVTVERPAEKPTEKTARGGMSRGGAAALAIKQLKGPTSKEELVQAADRLYAESGGVTNVKEARFTVRYALAVAEAFGVLELAGDTVRLATEATS